MKSHTLSLSAAIAVLVLAVGCASAEGLAPFPEWSEPRAITCGPHDHLLASYFAIDSWSPNKRYMLVLETDVNGRLPEAGERCTIGVVDMEDGNRFIPVTTTACWNFQEAAMAFWMDDDTILFNDLRDGKFMSGETYYNAYHERPWVLVRPTRGAGRWGRCRSALGKRARGDSPSRIRTPRRFARAGR